MEQEFCNELKTHENGSARNFDNPEDLLEGMAEGFGCGGWICSPVDWPFHVTY